MAAPAPQMPTKEAYRRYLQAVLVSKVSAAPTMAPRAARGPSTISRSHLVESASASVSCRVPATRAR